MATYFDSKQQTQDIKKFLKPHTLNKISEGKQKLEEGPKKILPVREQQPIKK